MIREESRFWRTWPSRELRSARPWNQPTREETLPRTYLCSTLCFPWNLRLRWKYDIEWTLKPFKKFKVIKNAEKLGHQQEKVYNVSSFRWMALKWFEKVNKPTSSTTRVVVVLQDWIHCYNSRGSMKLHASNVLFDHRAAMAWYGREGIKRIGLILSMG